MVSSEDEKVDAVLGGVEKIMFATSRLVVIKDGKSTQYRLEPGQYVVATADGKAVEAKSAIVVGEAHPICTFLVGFEGANFLSQCGEPATATDRCQEHQGR